MLSTPSFVYGLYLVFFLGRCDSKALLPALQHASSHFQNHSYPELDGFDEPQIVVDVEEPDIWEGSAKEGDEVYQEWDAAAKIGAQNYEALIGFFSRNPPMLGRLTLAQTRMLQMSRIPADAAKWSGYLFQPSEYDSYMGAGMGVCFSNVLFRCQINALPVDFRARWPVPGRIPNILPGALLIQEWLKDPDEPPSYEDNADVLWAMWLDDARRKKSQQGGLSHICYDPVTDEETLELLEYALAKYASDPKVSAIFGFPGFPRVPGANGGRGDAYNAILGSPAGRNVMSLLTQQKGPFNGKHVTEIYVISGPGRLKTDDKDDGDDDGKLDYALVFHLGMRKEEIR